MEKAKARTAGQFGVAVFAIAASASAFAQFKPAFAAPATPAGVKTSGAKTGVAAAPALPRTLPAKPAVPAAPPATIKPAPVASRGAPAMPVVPATPGTSAANAPTASAKLRAAAATNWKARQIVIPDSAKIPGLEWDARNAENLEVIHEPVGQDVQAYALVRGKLTTPEASLLLERRTLIEISPEGKFVVKLPLNKASSTFEFQSISKEGSTTSERIGIEFQDLADFLEDARNQLKRRSIIVGIGPGLTAYRQTRAPDLNQTSLVFKLGYHTVLTPRWDLGLGGFFTLLPIKSSIAGTKARYLGLNARVGYLFNPRSAWQFMLMGGAYFTSVYVTNDQFGYRNVFGPQIYPTVRRQFKSGQSVSAYFKVSPVTDGASFLPLSNRELATGVSWNHPIWRTRTLSTGLDFALLTFTQGVIKIVNRSVSLTVGIGW